MQDKIVSGKERALEVYPAVVSGVKSIWWLESNQVNLVRGDYAELVSIVRHFFTL